MYGAAYLLQYMELIFVYDKETTNPFLTSQDLLLRGCSLSQYLISYAY